VASAVTLRVIWTTLYGRTRRRVRPYRRGRRLRTPRTTAGVRVALPAGMYGGSTGARASPARPDPAPARSGFGEALWTPRCGTDLAWRFWLVSGFHQVQSLIAVASRQCPLHPPSLRRTGYAMSHTGSSGPAVSQSVK